MQQIEQKMNQVIAVLKSSQVSSISRLSTSITLMINKLQGVKDGITTYEAIFDQLTNFENKLNTSEQKGLEVPTDLKPLIFEIRRMLDEVSGQENKQVASPSPQAVMQTVPKLLPRSAPEPVVVQAPVSDKKSTQFLAPQADLTEFRSIFEPEDGATRRTSTMTRTNDPKKMTDALRTQLQNYTDIKVMKANQDLVTTKAQLEIKAQQIDHRLDEVIAQDESGNIKANERLEMMESKVAILEGQQHETVESIEQIIANVAEVLALKEQVKSLTDLVANADKQNEQYNKIQSMFDQLKKHNEQLKGEPEEGQHLGKIINAIDLKKMSETLKEQMNNYADKKIVQIQQQIMTAQSETEMKLMLIDSKIDEAINSDSTGYLKAKIQQKVQEKTISDLQENLTQKTELMDNIVDLMEQGYKLAEDIDFLEEQLVPSIQELSQYYTIEALIKQMEAEMLAMDEKVATLEMDAKNKRAMKLTKEILAK